MLPTGQIVFARTADVVDEIVEALLEVKFENIGQDQPRAVADLGIRRFERFEQCGLGRNANLDQRPLGVLAHPETNYFPSHAPAR